MERIEDMKFPLKARHILTPLETTVYLAQRPEHYSRRKATPYAGRTQFNEYGEIIGFCGVQTKPNEDYGSQRKQEKYQKAQGGKF